MPVDPEPSASAELLIAAAERSRLASTARHDNCERSRPVTRVGDLTSAVLLLCRLGLAAVFALAAVGKLADRPGARMAAVDFGAPQALAGPIAIALPLAEFVIAGLLVAADTARWGSLGAAALLVIFSAAIVLARGRGREPDCHCFGQLHSEPAGPKALARNAVLGAVAIFVVVAGWNDPGPGAFGWIGDLHGSGLLALIAGSTALVALAGGGSALLHLMRAYGRVLVRLDRVEHALAQAGLSVDPDDEPSMPQLGQTPGTPAPDFALPDTRGAAVTLDDLLAPGKPLLLLFTSPKCGPCAELLPAAAGWQHEGFPLTVALVSGGDADLVRADAEEHQLERVLLDDGYVVSSAYAANGTPSAVIISPDRTIASWVASGPDWIRRLVADAEAGPEGATGIAVGMPAPQLTLADLDGQRVDLSELRGDDMALLFWNPGCGHCRAIHADLLAWEAQQPAGATGLVVIASGDVAELRAEGFASPVLLDEDYAAGAAFDAVGTPMAVRLDADGIVASGVAAGADAVLALVGASPSRPVKLAISHVPRGSRDRGVDADLGTK